nr:MAG TPA: hypothetical protein [Caudoviricetes sp.]
MPRAYAGHDARRPGHAPGPRRRRRPARRHENS